MSYEEFDTKIHDCQAALELNRLRAEEIVNSFNQTIPNYLIDWANSLMKTAVEDNPELVISLGAEKIGKIKKRFSEILASIPDKSVKRVNEIKWIHREELPRDLENKYSLSSDLQKSVQNSMDDALRDLIG